MLAAAVRDGELSPEQREHLVTLLYRIEQAYDLARRAAAQRYPYDPEHQSAYVGALWEPGRHRVTALLA